MEEAAKRTAGVKDATVNFMMLKMTWNLRMDRTRGCYERGSEKTVKKVEDDCEIYL
mgnify:CR=1 FL=1